MNIEAIYEVFHRFEQVNESIIAGADILGRLTHLHVTRMYTWEIRKDRTARRMATPADMSLAGGIGCEHGITNMEHLYDDFRRTSPVPSPRA